MRPTRPFVFALAGVLIPAIGMTSPVRGQEVRVSPIGLRPSLSVVERADRSMEEGDAVAALDLLEQYLEAVPDDFGARWRAGVAAVALGIVATGTEIENRWYRRGMAHGDLALAARPDDVDALRASVAAKGSLSKQVSGREASRLGADVWEMTHKLLEANPDDAFAHDALGQFHYQVAKLSRIERFLGRVFVGAAVMDLGTWEGALMHHGRAVALEPDNLRYQVGLGLVLLGHDDFAQAIVHLEAALAIPVTTPWDEDFYLQARRFLARALKESGSDG